MVYKELFDGAQIPGVGFGTWEMGGRSQPNTLQDDKEIEAIRTAIDKGITHIDTAEKYGNGHSEEMIRQAIKDKERKKLFISSKVSPAHLRYDDVLHAAEKSLKRLNTGYLDMYLIHQYNPEISLSETMKAMNRLVDEKMVRYIGVSNFQVRQMREAQYYSSQQIAINWLLAKVKVITIPKASNINHLEDNLGALGWSLAEEDIKRLDKGI